LKDEGRTEPEEDGVGREDPRTTLRKPS
jgi:hypothetical protein